MLSARQTALYQHRCEIWRSQQGFAPDGRPLQDTWTQIAADVPAYFETGQSQQGPDSFLRVESDNLFTLDRVHMEAGTDVAVDDFLKQTTGPDAGIYWRVRGNAQTRSRRANKLMVLASRDQPEEGID